MKEKLVMLARQRAALKLRARKKREAIKARKAKRQDAVRVFNEEYRDLKGLMTEFKKKIKVFKEGRFSFDWNIAQFYDESRSMFVFDMKKDHYYDFFDQDLYERIKMCINKYGGKLGGDHGKERKLWGELREFKAEMERWREIEDKLKGLYEHPFSREKKETRQTFRGKLLNMVKGNNFATTLFRWACRKRGDDATYFYKGFTFGAVFHEAMTGKSLSNSTHYIKVGDIFRLIINHCEENFKTLSEMQMMLFYKHAKNCEIAKYCFHVKFPKKADGMDFWANQQKKYKISFN